MRYAEANRLKNRLDVDVDEPGDANQSHEAKQGSQRAAADGLDIHRQDGAHAALYLGKQHKVPA
ncbi:hypothetical protein AWV80_38675 [Cupriavidus sp. UYMU48A]|nr:hypothetical protein AWV80_38675 [Cupriavidus sp. UYMU48A]